MKERICARCKKHIDGPFVELSVTFREFKNGTMKKVDLHRECFEEVWDETHQEEEEEA